MSINLKKSNVTNNSHINYSKEIVFGGFSVLGLISVALKTSYKENQLFTILLLVCFVIANIS